ncbi:MAG: hypothetical protein IJN88_02150 [Clostridia bacterium]|nr:hypothetical protein [Clostridia bacterium]
MDVAFDFLLEVLVDNLVNITLSVVPENKHSGKLETVLSIIIVILTFLFLILFVVGICMLRETDGESVLGKVFILLMPVQIILSVIVYIIKKMKGIK